MCLCECVVHMSMCVCVVSECGVCECVVRVSRYVSVCGVYVVCVVSECGMCEYVVCVWCSHLCACMYVWAYGHPRLILGVFFNRFPLYLLRSGSLLNPELTGSGYSH